MCKRIAGQGYFLQAIEARRRKGSSEAYVCCACAWKEGWRVGEKMTEG